MNSTEGFWTMIESLLVIDNALNLRLFDNDDDKDVAKIVNDWLENVSRTRARIKCNSSENTSKNGDEISLDFDYGNLLDCRYYILYVKRIDEAFLMSILFISCLFFLYFYFVFIIVCLIRFFV